MKPIVAAMILQGVAWGGSCHAQLVTNTSNIRFWVGSGTNSSVLVLDFQDDEPNQAFAWGYRFNGPAPSGARMLFDIAAADPNLSISYFGTAERDLFLTTISYFDGNTQHSQTTGDFETDARYWGYFVAGGLVFDATAQEEIDLDMDGPFGGSSAPQVWLEAPCGASDTSFGDPGRFVSGFSWDMWVFGESGTIPGSEIYAASPPSITKPEAAIQLSSGRAVVSVPALSGYNYFLTYSGDPGGPWTNATAAVSGTNGTLSFTNTFSQETTQRFYRVAVTQ